MHVILVYDINVERVGKVLRCARRYLPRIQNSVFEGDISVAKLEQLKAALRSIIDPDEDSVLIWLMRDARLAERQTLGFEKLPVSTFL